jgi:hypothetical protein
VHRCGSIVRSLASAIAIVVAACSAPVPPPAPRAPSAAPRSRSRAPCATITDSCDPSIADADAFAVVQKQCWACHEHDGIANHDFDTLAALKAAPVAEMVGTCQMPPDGAPLPEADRHRLVAWSRCQK